MEGFEPSPDFNPEHNKQVIEDSIKATDRAMRMKDHRFEQEVGERAWAASKYLKGLQTGKGTSDPIKFFGKDYTMYLKGKSVIDRVYDKLNVVKNGKVIRKAE